MHSRNAFVMLTLILVFVTSEIQFARAGSFSVPPSTIFGTVVSFSASYPEFRFGESATISISVSVTFNNLSVSAVNLTAIQVRLYSLETDLNIIAEQGYPSATMQGSFAYASWLSTEYYGSFPYNTSSTPDPVKIMRPSPEVTSNSWNSDLKLEFMDRRDYEVEAKLYVQATLIFLDAEGKPLWSSSTDLWGGSYHWVLYSSEGEALRVTINSASSQFWLRPEIVVVLLGAVGFAIVALGVVFLRRKKISKDVRPPPPPSSLQKSSIQYSRY